MKKGLLFATLLLSLNGLAQTTISINSIDPITSPADDTVLAGSSRTYTVWVKNEGPAPFNDQLWVYSAVRDSSLLGLDTVDVNVLGTMTINPFDSIAVSLTANYTISSNGYKYGIDVIVIWPYAPSAITNDS